MKLDFPRETERVRYVLNQVSTAVKRGDLDTPNMRQFHHGCGATVQVFFRLVPSQARPGIAAAGAAPATAPGAVIWFAKRGSRSPAVVLLGVFGVKVAH